MYSRLPEVLPRRGTSGDRFHWRTHRYDTPYDGQQENESNVAAWRPAVTVTVRIMTATVPQYSYLSHPLGKPAGHADVFEYSPESLKNDEIRLIHLKPAESPEDVVKCDLVRAQHHQDSGSSQALSYIWGNPARTRRIKVDGKDFALHENLYDAIVHLRSNKSVWCRVFLMSNSSGIHALLCIR